MSFSKTLSLWRCGIVGCRICLNAIDRLGSSLNLRVLLHISEAWMIRLLSFLNFCMLAGFSQFFVGYWCQETSFFHPTLSFSGFSHIWKIEATQLWWMQVIKDESILYVLYLQVHSVWDILLKKCVEVFHRVFILNLKGVKKIYSRHSICWK